MISNILYYAQAVAHTYFFRFYENGLVLQTRVKDQEVSEHRDKIPAVIVKETYGVKKGQFRVIDNKIIFDIDCENDIESYQGEIRNDGNIQLTIYVLSSKKRGSVVVKPWDDAYEFNWKSVKYNSDPAGLLDLRRSTYQ